MKTMRFQTPFTKAFTKATLGLLMSAAVITGCKKDDVIDNDDDNPPIVTDKPLKEVSGILTGEVKFYADTVYLLKGFVRVGEDDGTTIKSTGKLTIEPGTLILGDKESKGTLIVQRGSQIFAVGTADNPIVFTSERPIGLRQPGDWSGVVLCGRAFNNLVGSSTSTVQLEGGYGAYHGGQDDDDNSGELKYVRIEYAGNAINPNEEVNSLTMGSVGRGTKISYVQASYGLDDAFEWFGGTVNATNLIAYRGLDDDWDLDQGYKGNLQFALSIKDPNLADQSGSNGFEVDGPDGGHALGGTSAKIANFTVIGPKQNRGTTISTNYQHAIQIRRSAKISIYNSFFTGYPSGIALESQNTLDAATNGELNLKGNILTAINHWGGNGFGGAGTLFEGAPANGAQHPNPPRGVAFRSNPEGYDVEGFWKANNEFLNDWAGVIDASIFDVGVPTLLPVSGSKLLSGAVDVPAGLQQVSYRGAFDGTNDWTQGWTEWNPQIKDYTK